MVGENGQASVYEALGKDFGGDDFQRAARKLDQLSERWNNRLSIDNLALAKRYIKGEMILLVDLAVSRGSRHSKNCRAIFQRELPISEPKPKNGEMKVCWRNHPDACGVASVKFSEVNPEGIVRGPYRNDHSVLVENVEFVGQPESLVVPSMVWLESLDNINSVLGRSLYRSAKFGYKFFGGGEDRKLRLSYVSSSETDHLTSDKIKGGSEIMDSVTNDTAQADGHILSDPEIVDEVSRLRIFIGDDFIRCAVVKGGDFRVDVVDMAFGPFDL